jgi:outer membrane receptor protein involved in Fe transport
VGLRYQVASSLSLHTAGYQAFRAPNLAELYRKFVSGANTSLPNPALKPEYATGYEAGFDWQPASWVQLKGTGFSADMRDLNTFVTIAPGQRQRQNVQKSRARGGEAYLALRPTQPLFVSASVSYDNARLLAGPAGTVVGSRVSRVPMQKQVVRVSYTTPILGSLTVIGRHEGVTTTFSGVGLEPFTVVDANYQHELFPGLDGFVSVENVGDKAYQVNLTGTIVSLGLPRTVRVGLEAYRF